MVKILSSHCRGHRFESLVRKLRSHKLPGVAKKKKQIIKLLWGRGRSTFLWKKKVPGALPKFASEQTLAPFELTNY